MLHASQLPKFLWGEAMKHAVYLKNRTSTKALDGKTPYEAFFGKKPNLTDLHEFGSKVWVHSLGGSKLEGRSDIGRWVGFDEESNGHRIYWPGKRSVSVERSVKFDPDADVFLPNSALLGGGGQMPKVTSSPTQPAIPVIPAPQPILPPAQAVPFDDNPVVDPLGENFEHPPPDQGHPRHIQTESA